MQILVYLIAFTALWCAPVDGKSKRDAKARAEFVYQHPCPSTGMRKGACPGWVVDHVVPLACGGADKPENMQWQTRVEAKAKDRWERIDCRR